MHKNVLIIGASSKLARVFVSKQEDATTTFWLTYRAKPQDIQEMPPTNSQILKLDLSDEESVITICQQLKEVCFDSVIFFGATYESDATDSRSLYEQHLLDIATNVISFHTICKSLRYNAGAMIVALGDAELDRPKKNYGSYTLSKQLLQRTVESLAVDLAPQVRVVEIRLGPTLPQSKKPTYYNRCLLKPQNPEIGLVKLIDFLISNKDVFITGTSITYDGGARLSR